MRKFNYQSDYKNFDCDEFVKITFINEGGIFTKKAQIISIDSEKISFADEEAVYKCVPSEILCIKKVFLKRAFKVLYVPTACVIFAYVLYLLVDFLMFTPFPDIPREKIPADSLATERKDEYGATYMYHMQAGKMCVSQGEMAAIEPPHPCTDWIKEYGYDGTLSRYVAYDIKGTAGRYEEVKRYEIIFHRNGKIASIGNRTLGVEYFDERGNLIKKCDGFQEGLIGSRTCKEYDKDKEEWITREDYWIT